MLNKKLECIKVVILSIAGLLLIMIMMILVSKVSRHEIPEIINTNNDIFCYRPIDALTLIKDYKNNEINANCKYKEKHLNVHGSINDIKDYNNYFVIELKEDGYYKTICCSFSKESKYYAKCLQVGEYINIKGVCKGENLLGNIKLDYCKI